jgi:hypothetical protein
MALAGGRSPRVFSDGADGLHVEVKQARGAFSPHLEGRDRRQIGRSRAVLGVGRAGVDRLSLYFQKKKKKIEREREKR